MIMYLLAGEARYRCKSVVYRTAGSWITDHAHVAFRGEEIVWPPASPALPLHPIRPPAPVRLSTSPASRASGSGVRRPCGFASRGAAGASRDSANRAGRIGVWCAWGPACSSPMTGEWRKYAPGASDRGTWVRACLHRKSGRSRGTNKAATAIPLHSGPSPFTAWPCRKRPHEEAGADNEILLLWLRLAWCMRLPRLR